MMSTVLSISVAYVMVAVLLLIIGLTSRIHWRWKALVIIGTTFFFVSVFFQTRNLLGWPSNAKLPIPAQLLWARVVEPNRMASEPGSVFMWVEQLDENNIPMGMPRAYRLPYSRVLADKAQKARDKIMEGNPLSLQEDLNPGAMMMAPPISIWMRLISSSNWTRSNLRPCHRPCCQPKNCRAERQGAFAQLSWLGGLNLS